MGFNSEQWLFLQVAKCDPGEELKNELKVMEDTTIEYDVDTRCFSQGDVDGIGRCCLMMQVCVHEGPV